MLSRFARICLGLAGWTVIGAKPDVPKMVITAYPHTSNWDLLIYVLTAWGLGVPLSWMGKDALFRGPTGVLMRLIGGIPIRRDRRENVVDQMNRNFAEREELCLLIAPEGTRSHVAYLKSGFYHIATTAGVPIVPSFIDYSRKEAGMSILVEPSADVSKDMDQIREFYRGRVGRYPENAGALRLREEEEDYSSGSAPTSTSPDR